MEFYVLVFVKVLQRHRINGLSLTEKELVSNIGLCRRIIDLFKGADPIIIAQLCNSFRAEHLRPVYRAELIHHLSVSSQL